MVTNFEILLLIMNENLDRVKLFEQFDGYMQNHEHN